jgi:hypothetical protein
MASALRAVNIRRTHPTDRMRHSVETRLNFLPRSWFKARIAWSPAHVRNASTCGTDDAAMNPAHPRFTAALKIAVEISSPTGKPPSGRLNLNRST